jgi:hypothetical protein
MQTTIFYAKFQMGVVFPCFSSPLRLCAAHQSSRSVQAFTICPMFIAVRMTLNTEEQHGADI